MRGTYKIVTSALLSTRKVKRRMLKRSPKPLYFTKTVSPFSWVTLDAWLEGAAPSISAAAINEEIGIYLSVQGQLGANTHAVTLAIESALQELKPNLQAQHVTLHEGLFRPANFIETAIDGVRTDILIGSILVISILFLFLFNARTAFISATAIPLSLLTAIVVMSYYNVGLNIMVLGGLAIALGEVVDDAIIDTENIFRRLRENRSLANPLPIYQVVYQASMEVRSSVVYATIIVALVVYAATHAIRSSR